MKPISADSHVCEPPNCYVDYIEPKYRADAPRVVRDANGADAYWIKNEPKGVAIPLIAAAGRDPRDVGVRYNTYDEMYPGGWDGKVRLADQDRDGVGGEVIYPSVGMALCRNPDVDYKQACMNAYNRWLQEFVSAAPDRLFGVGQTAVRSVAEAVEDFRRIRDMGFKGVMLPGVPGTAEDYDSPVFDPLWRAAVELGLPLSFHVLTSSADGLPRGPMINLWSGVVRSVQDIIGMFIFSGVFNRHPALKLVCVEGDAGWVPHFTYRLDHIYKRHRYVKKCVELDRLPSQQFAENIYLTFQDDWVAFRWVGLHDPASLNPRRLMWANDFPHNDSTWPNSQALLAEHTAGLSAQEKAWILHDNVSELYGLAGH